MAVATSSIVSLGTVPTYNAVGATPFWGSHELVTTEIDSTDDQVLLYLFTLGNFNGQMPRSPEGLRVDFDDIDTNGTPLHDCDFGIGDVDGVIDAADVLISSCTAGRTGGNDEVDANNGTVIEITAKYLIMDTTAAAATAAAGGVAFAGVYYGGLQQVTGTS